MADHPGARARKRARVCVCANQCKCNSPPLVKPIPWVLHRVDNMSLTQQYLLKSDVIDVTM